MIDIFFKEKWIHCGNPVLEEKWCFLWMLLFAYKTSVSTSGLQYSKLGIRLYSDADISSPLSTFSALWLNPLQNLISSY